MDPIPAVGVRLLLRQCCLKEFSDPAGFNSRRRVAVHWKGRQPSCRGEHVLQRVSIMTRWYWHILRRGRVHPGRPHHLWLNRGPRPGHYDPRRVTRPCTWRIEEVSRIVDRRESRLGLLMPLSHDLIGRVLIHREPERLCLNQLSLGIESRPLRSQPDPFRCKILFSFYQIQF